MMTHHGRVPAPAVIGTFPQYCAGVSAVTYRRPAARTAATLLLVAAAVAAACADSTGSLLPGRTHSIVDPQGLPADQTGIALPDTVRGGASLVVPFFTSGSSSCTVAVGEDVAVLGQTVTITPYDRAIPPGSVCTGDLRRFARQTAVRAPTGEVTFQLRGRRLGASPDEPLTVLSRAVVVLPQ